MTRKMAALVLLVLVYVVAIPTALSVQFAQLTQNTQTNLTIRTGTASGIIIKPCDPGSGGGGEGVINH
jgi:uncharacterized membrane protein